MKITRIPMRPMIPAPAPPRFKGQLLYGVTMTMDVGGKVVQVKGEPGDTQEVIAAKLKAAIDEAWPTPSPAATAAPAPPSATSRPAP